MWAESEAGPRRWVGANGRARSFGGGWLRTCAVGRRCCGETRAGRRDVGAGWATFQERGAVRQGERSRGRPALTAEVTDPPCGGGGWRAAAPGRGVREGGGVPTGGRGRGAVVVKVRPGPGLGLPSARP